MDNLIVIQQNIQTKLKSRLSIHGKKSHAVHELSQNVHLW